MARHKSLGHTARECKYHVVFIPKYRASHLWQARFYSCALDERHAWQALAYVECNPVRAALVRNAGEYPWSTAAAHCREDSLDGCLDVAEWRRHFTGARWREVLRIGVREEALEDRIREAARRGCPLGSDAFVERIGRALGRNLRPRPPGRPPKKTALTLAVTGQFGAVPTWPGAVPT